MASKLTPSTAEPIFNEWVVVLRKYGAVFDNVCFMENQEGISVHVGEASRPYRIYLPQAVLLDINRLDFSGADMAFDAAGLPADLAVLWRGLFDITLAQGRTRGLQETLKSFHELPEVVKNKARALGLGYFFDPQQWGSPAQQKNG